MTINPKLTSYQDVENYLNSFILYSDLRLDRIKKLLAVLGEPQKSYPSIIVGGTAGKGSTATFLASILQSAGYKTGLYTSPHLVKLNERFIINGGPISDSRLVQLAKFVHSAFSIQHSAFSDTPSYFEILTAIAFAWFSRQKIDVAVLEVGMGGRWDAVNVVDNKIAVVTNIGLDHTKFLGKTLGQIAGEKIAIVKKKGILVTGSTQPKIIRLARRWVEIQQAKLVLVKPDYHLKTNLLGEFQKNNASLAVAAARQFDPKISQTAIKEGLLKAYIPGRLEIVRKNLILDGAHNPLKMKALTQSLKKLWPEQKFTVLLAIKKDKNAKSMLKHLLPLASQLIITKFTKFTDAGAGQAMKPEKIAALARKIDSGIKITVIPNPKLALKITMKQLNNVNNDYLLITGSLYLVGEIKNII